jgi:spore photoproduct lyase
MTFELDAVFIEEASRNSALTRRILGALAPTVDVHYVADGRAVARPTEVGHDPFGAGKRRLVLMRRRSPFLQGCPAGSTKFACCNYLVLLLASNCPMDCSYCFLQEYVADNPSFQIFANFADAFGELDRLNPGGRSIRVGTGELADSLAFDSITQISRDLVEYFSRRNNLLLELKTKTDEIASLLTVDPKGNTLVSWTLSPERVFASSEHRTAAPGLRISAARQVSDAGYKIAFHLDPIIAYPGAEADYGSLFENLFDVIEARSISFISMGGLRMTPALRKRARERFPTDPMLLGEEVLAPDGRYRAFTPLRLKLYSRLRESVARYSPDLPIYLCMESASVHRRVMGEAPPSPASLGATLARA